MRFRLCIRCQSGRVLTYLLTFLDRSSTAFGHVLFVARQRMAAISTSDDEIAFITCWSTESLRGDVTVSAALGIRPFWRHVIRW